MKEMSRDARQGCCCEKCKAACRYRPGWFLPGEVEKVASHLEIPLEDLFKTYLAVDWWVDEPDIFLLSPALVGGDTGTEFPADPRGACVFFKDGLCKIHPVKPFECYKMLHSDGREVVRARHKQIAAVWGSKQDQIKELLGREPTAAGSF